MTADKEILAVAAREIGYREGPGKRNKYGEWFHLDGVAWCMEFVQWVYAQAGMALPYRTASCGALLNWYRARKPECIVRDPVPGCIVIFDFPGTKYSTDHTGIFVSRTGTTITTIDGNTSNGNESNGGWVQQRTRSLSYANPIYIIPEGTAGTEGPEGVKEEEDMKRYQTIEEIRKDAAYAAPTVEKLIDRNVLRGTGAGLDVSEDMLRLLVWNDRAGLYG